MAKYILMHSGKELDCKIESVSEDGRFYTVNIESENLTLLNVAKRFIRE